MVPDVNAKMARAAHEPDSGPGLSRFGDSAVKTLLPSLLVLLLLRIPAWFEPYWYTDEAGYLTVGRELLHGKVLYVTAWNNKPPLMLWTMALDYRIFGASEAGLHVLTLISAVCTLLGVWFGAKRLLSSRATLLILLATAIVLGLPITDAELALPESLLIAPCTWAGILVILACCKRLPASMPPVLALVLAGLLDAAGLGFQQTAVADIGAMTLILLASSMRLRYLTAYLSAVVLPTLLWVVLVLGAAGDKATEFALFGFYIAYTKSAIPSMRILAELHLVGVGLLALLIVCVCVLYRRRAECGWMFMVWTLADLGVVAAANQPYPHFLTPAVAPGMMAMGSLLPGIRQVLSEKRGWVMAGAFLLASSMASVIRFDWMSTRMGTVDGVTHRNLATYYGGFIALILGKQSSTSWAYSFDARAPAVVAMGAWLHQHNATGETAVVWSADAWPYLLGDLPVTLPTPPIYNDNVLLGGSRLMSQRVASIAPEVLIVSHGAFMEFKGIAPLLQLHYTKVFTYGPEAIYLRDGTAATKRILA